MLFFCMYVSLFQLAESVKLSLMPVVARKSHSIIFFVVLKEVHNGCIIKAAESQVQNMLLGLKMLC